jgi:RNA polymerase sigma-70 factor (ECF subfamily)
MPQASDSCAERRKITESSYALSRPKYLYISRQVEGQSVTSIELRPGDTTQAGRLFEEYSERLFKFCHGRLGSRSEAEDAVQTSFLYAHGALQRGVVPESEAAWLYTIAKNVCRWQQRTTSRRGSPANGFDIDAFPSPERGGDEDELLMGLEDALATIPERQRHALLLREWRGLSCPEIATHLELSEPATHALLTRARRSLAGALTTAARRPVLGVDFGSLVLQLRAFFAGGAAKVAAAAIVAVGVGAGGVSVERALSDSRPGAPTPDPPSLVGAEPTSKPSSNSAVPRNAPGRSPNPVSKPHEAVSATRAESHPSFPAADGGAGAIARAPGQPSSDEAPAPATSATDRPNTGNLPVEAPVPEVLPDLPVDLPPLPGVDLPVDVEPPALPLPPIPPLPSLPDLPTSGLPPLPTVPNAGSGVLP